MDKSIPRKEPQQKEEKNKGPILLADENETHKEEEEILMKRLSAGVPAYNQNQIEVRFHEYLRELHRAAGIRR